MTKLEHLEYLIDSGCANIYVTIRETYLEDVVNVRKMNDTTIAIADKYGSVMLDLEDFEQYAEIL